MEEKLNIFKKTLLFLQSYSKSRFGSGVIGFMICAVVVWYGMIDNLRQTVLSLQNENKELKHSIEELQNKIVIIREEIRREVTQEQRESMQFTYEYIQKLQQDISKSNIKKSKEVEQLEREIERRKETTQ